METKALDNTTMSIATIWIEQIEHSLLMIRISMGSCESNSEYHQEEYRKSIARAHLNLDRLKKTLGL